MFLIPPPTSSKSLESWLKFSLLLFVLPAISACVSTNNDTPAPVYMYGSSDGVGTAGVHTVSDGDTVSNIAQRYNVSADMISSINNLTSGMQVASGQRLRLPPSPDLAEALPQFFSEPIMQAPQIQMAAVRPAPVIQQPLLQQAVYTPPPLPQNSNTRFHRPVNGAVLSGFGDNGMGQKNDGINIAAPAGAVVKSAEAGEVVYVGKAVPAYGNIILVKHQGGYVTAYGHLAETHIAKGQKVARGQPIGTVGATGNVARPQLHFEVRKGKAPQNPADYI